MSTLVLVCGAQAADEMMKEWEGRSEFKGQYSVQRLDNADVFGPSQAGSAMMSVGQGVTVLVVTASRGVRDALHGSVASKAPGITRDFLVEEQIDKAPGITRDFVVEEQPDKAPGITRDFVAEE